MMIDGVTLNLCEPDQVPLKWVGHQELVIQVLAAWLVVGDEDLPLSPRLVGKPGVGKTTLAYHAGKNPQPAGLSVSIHHGYET